MKNNILTWDEYFMSLAIISSLRSKDPNTKVGACIVNNDNKVISLGYNGMPLGNDEEFSWKRDENDALDNKYFYVVHAEINALINSKTNLNDSKIYVSLFPCSNCAKSIVQSGVKKIYYSSDKYADLEDTIASKKILNTSNIELIELNYEEIKNKLKNMID